MYAIPCVLSLVLSLSLIPGSVQNCWWTGCQPYNWAVRRCNDNNFVQTSSTQCSGRDMFECCSRGSNNGGGGSHGRGESGQCSYYGAEAQRGYTASGQIFDYRQMTAAHKTLPFGTKIKVTNGNNGKSVVVVVNDRGPFVAGRIFDLSQGSFERIARTAEGVVPCSFVFV